MKYAAVLLVLSALAGYASAQWVATDVNARAGQFQDFMNKYGKQYVSLDEYQKRFETFSRNLDMIESHNLAGKSWTMGVNQYADMEWEEFKSTRLSKTESRVARNPINLVGLVNVPDEVDWRKKGAVTAVKNQQQCGSCWAFSTTGSIEGAHFLKTGALVSLSEQQLVDCSGSYGNNGCEGGLMDRGFEYVIKTGGLVEESAYPYQAEDGTCEASKFERVVRIRNYQDVEQYNEDALKAAVAQQPISVAIEADQNGFQFYNGGVFDGYCGTSLDHGVLVVGYGTESGKDYWLIKNSWGGSWGDQGYIKIVRGLGGAGQCGVAEMPSYPIA